MKCFRIDICGETFHYCAETAEDAKREYLDTYDEGEEDFKDAQISEVSDEAMLKYTVRTEEDRDGAPYTATLKEVFDEHSQAGKVVELCSSAY